MKQRVGKGQGISLDGGTSHLNHYKQEFSRTPPAPIREFAPLVSWPVAKHPRQDALDDFRSIASWKP